MKKNNLYIIFALLGAVIVLWQLLASGYVLTLDMIFGPHINLVPAEGALINTLPTKYVLSFLTFVFNGWIAQKILLITIFFLLFYLPLHFFKKIFKIENTHGAEYVSSLFFAINPFVYERFLAGQWAVIFGYALLVPLTTYLIEFCREWTYKNGLKFLWVIILMGAISTHYLMISLILIAIFLIVNFIKQKFSFDFLKKSLLLALGVLVISSYWIVPAMLSKNTPITTFSSEHWEVFKTASDISLGTVGNVLTLHGFWGEHEPWVERFLLPKEFGLSFGIFFTLLFTLVISGIYLGFKDKRLRFGTGVAVFVMFLSLVFSCGVADSIFKNLNMWMFENISFWKGFRDSEKWSGVLALGYALFAGLGTQTILGHIKKLEYRRIVFYILISIPLFITPMMLFGFAGQLQTVQYPKEWAEVNNILKQDQNCKALFLPWHQYYSLKWNDDILTANVSRSYFDCDIVHGKNMELGSIESQGGNGEEYAEIEKLVIDNDANPDSTIEFLRQKGIKYIIYTNDVESEDDLEYPFLGSKYTQKVINRWTIDLYSTF
jgi:hypothetical protein